MEFDSRGEQVTNDCCPVQRGHMSVRAVLAECMWQVCGDGLDDKGPLRKCLKP